jgi:hypothetical protein
MPRIHFGLGKERVFSVLLDRLGAGGTDRFQPKAIHPSRSPESSAAPLPPFRGHNASAARFSSGYLPCRVLAFRIG